jgi:glycosyltransferase involved in cell wall biosynthesis
MGIAVRVFSLTRAEYWEAPLGEAGVPVEWVGRRSGRLARLLTMARALGRYRPDVIHSFHFFANPYAALAARALNRPDLGAIRSSGRGDFDSVSGPMGQLCVRLPRVLLANSDAAIADLRSRGIPARRLRYLPNAVDVDAFEPVTRPPAPVPFTVAAIGRFTGAKRFDRALRVFARLNAEVDPDARLVLAGDGPERPALEALARQMDLEGKVTFTGVLTDVRPLLRDTDCLLLSSDHEGTPNVVLEAMASARPIVATAVGGVAALVQAAGAGLLATPDDEASLSAALAQLATDAPLRARSGRQGREYVQRHHSFATLQDRISAIYREVLPAGPLAQPDGAHP